MADLTVSHPGPRPRYGTGRIFGYYGLEGQFEEAYRQAFATGVARVFLVAALLALACAALAWATVPARTAPRAGELPGRVT